MQFQVHCPDSDSSRAERNKLKRCRLVEWQQLYLSHRITPLRYTSVILAMPLQITLWGVVPDASIISGLTLIISIGLLAMYRERLRCLGRA
jgi:hypothetical protein